jgi:hypothetical protein
MARKSENGSACFVPSSAGKVGRREQPSPQSSQRAAEKQPEKIIRNQRFFLWLPTASQRPAEAGTTNGKSRIPTVCSPAFRRKNQDRKKRDCVEDSSPAHRGRFALPDAGRAATVGRGVPAEPSLRQLADDCHRMLDICSHWDTQWHRI